MPRRTDLKKILLIGSGPIVIGQACEFDYSGTQACKALREEGYTVVLVNSNPATIMTDPETADRTYIEPITWEVVAKIIERERPDALLPTLGGQTALNTAMDAAQARRPGEVQGRDDRRHAARHRQGRGPREVQAGHASASASTCPKAAWRRRWPRPRRSATSVGLPCVLRPSFTLGGTGGGIAYNREEFNELIAHGLDLSPVGEVLIEESVIGWKEFELEVMRDRADNVVIVCSIENFDPMGVHTGDSITVAPAQTLTDKEYQRMRDAALAIIREIGVETGGSNIQFAVNPDNGHMIAIEMNPRVCRSSALASKATGFPIAKIAAKLAVGYRLDELRNDITRETPACFEPTIDYVVTKVPRWAFEKFPDADPTLTTQMKSVGETMAIGRTFKESLQKALRGLETGRFGLGCDRADLWGTPKQPTVDEIVGPPGHADRRTDLVHPLRLQVRPVGGGHPSADEDRPLVPAQHPRADRGGGPAARRRRRMRTQHAIETIRDVLLEAKQHGFSDRQLGAPVAHRPRARSAGCARNWASCRRTSAWTPARPSSRPIRPIITPPMRRQSFTTENAEARKKDRQRLLFRVFRVLPMMDDETVPPSGKDRIMILGGGPNRIGQGIEFDYCCCQAAFALKEAGYETIMVNSNPETVSTDYDTSDHLFFEPLTAEDVLNICDRMKPAGLIVQFGGQTPLNLARALADAGAPIIGTSVDSIDAAEDRELFQELVDRLGLKQPANGTVRDLQQAIHVARRIGYPGAGAAQLRAGRPRHGDRLRRGGAEPLRRARPSSCRRASRS